MPIHGEPTLIEQARNVITTYNGTFGSGMSIVDVAKIARVEPITLISSNLSGTKELYNVLHGVLNIYAAYHLQAVSLLGTQIYDSRILKILDKTNPDRDVKTFLAAGQLVGESQSITAESYKTMSLTDCKFGLPFAQSDKKSWSAESASTDTFGYGDQDSQDLKQRTDLGASIGKIDSFDKLGMTVGKIVDVSFSIQSKDKKNSDENATNAKIPVVVKLDTMVMPGATISDIATLNADEITFGSRLNDAINGRISFIKDFILCSDLIKAQKKTMIKDPTGFYTQLLKRVNNSKLYSALSGNVSVAGVSAIIVMSEMEENEIQKRIGGRLSNLKTREMVFNNISAMMIVVIDREWERVSIYIRDIDGFSQAPFSSFKTSEKNTDVMDLFKTLSMSNAPSF
ncbi:hypothetical protein [Flavobacterium sp.]|jgi:hypothetical protein|uniref:hypothetical protein n=1 Tax=Flavobacterium sp. TaxID=239 RepID=UPI0037C196C6